MFNLGVFATYVAVVTFSPGPNNLMAMANASRFGLKGTLRFMAGAGTGVFAVITASCYFNLVLFNLIPRIKPVMSLIGAAYMCYLAVKFMRAKPAAESSEKDALQFWTGLAVQFVNPKFLLYALTVTSTFIVPYFGAGLYIPFSLLIMTICVLSLVVWALFGTTFKRFLSRYYRPFNLLMGGLLLYSAYAISGLGQWM